ncbi:Protein CBG17860 [Caenorhabditis briggsae]|uniref:Protein CBG17860 n=1 Tax=Caenorhabditis briggsae TaxID=6238 RepID=A8XRX9_CAEBR|nr:Protein CBG17860 [Caenorhabditis briggsae]CAP35405.1 Protein CBG17860 [Caenorhabditis briggsae]
MEKSSYEESIENVQNVLIRLSSDLNVYFVIVATLNSILHPISYIFMSSQYRETLKSVLGGKRKSVISVQPRLSSFVSTPAMCVP